MIAASARPVSQRTREYVPASATMNSPSTTRLNASPSLAPRRRSSSNGGTSTNKLSVYARLDPCGQKMLASKRWNGSVKTACALHDRLHLRSRGSPKSTNGCASEPGVGRIMSTTSPTNSKPTSPRRRQTNRTCGASPRSVCSSWAGRDGASTALIGDKDSSTGSEGPVVPDVAERKAGRPGCFALGGMEPELRRARGNVQLDGDRRGLRPDVEAKTFAWRAHLERPLW